MRKLFNKAFRSFWIMHHLSKYQWYRKWYGGRWEYHCIDICHGFLWLHMTPPNVWPDYRQPCSVGAPVVEDW